MAQWFDDLSRMLASPMPRRRALLIIAGTVVSTALASLRPARAQVPTCGSVDCPPGQSCCNSTFGLCCPDTGTCCSFGTAAAFCCTAAGQACCAGFCCPTQQQCCATSEQTPLCCPDGYKCCDVARGTCCPVNSVCCGSTCCPAGQLCNGGTCVEICDQPTQTCRTPCGAGFCNPDDLCCNDTVCCPFSTSCCLDGCCQLGCDVDGLCIPF